MNECATCGGSNLIGSRLRPNGHAEWCWSNDPTKPDKGHDGPVRHLRIVQ